jgi:hypothetical protein
MMILHSLMAGLGGRVCLCPLSRSISFYETHGFQETGAEKDGMMIYEVRSEDALAQLAGKELI